MIYNDLKIFWAYILRIIWKKLKNIYNIEIVFKKCKKYWIIYNNISYLSINYYYSKNNKKALKKL